MTAARGCGLVEFISVGMMVIFGCVTSPTFAQNTGQPLPVVTSASVPLYPRTALLAHIQGTVKIRVTTDGKRASSLDAESGPPMLAQAAEDNIRTWQFEEHKPLTFLATFHYVIEQPPGCSVGNTTAILHMPTDVEVRANGLHTCDPASTAPKSERK
jgi:hypothetical protein